MRPNDEFLDGLLKILTEAPRTQIDEDIVADIKKFMSEEHTRDEKYDFIQNIANEPLNMISDTVGVGRITPFVKMVCNLDATFGETIAPTIAPEEVVPDGYIRKYGWDGKPILVPEEPIFSAITVQYLVEHQDKDIEEDVLVDIFSYMEDLMWANKFDVIDDFIKEFCECEHEICFQHCLCLLTAACWAKDKIKNKEMLVEKTKAQGIKEIGEKDTMSCLKGLI
jgi:hypothetical protein